MFFQSINNPSGYSFAPFMCLPCQRMIAIMISISWDKIKAEETPIGGLSSMTDAEDNQALF